MLTDAQTSGGLLLCCRADAVDQLLDGLRAQGTPCAAVIGKMTIGEAGTVRVR
jgi:selenide, water dikinase